MNDFQEPSRACSPASSPLLVFVGSHETAAKAALGAGYLLRPLASPSPESIAALWLVGVGRDALAAAALERVAAAKREDSTRLRARLHRATDADYLACVEPWLPATRAPTRDAVLRWALDSERRAGVPLPFPVELAVAAVADLGLSAQPVAFFPDRPDADWIAHAAESAVALLQANHWLRLALLAPPDAFEAFFQRAPPGLASRLRGVFSPESAPGPERCRSRGEQRAGPSLASVARALRDAVAAGDEQGARSAAEAFLFARLEAHPSTAGRFELNGRLQAGSQEWEVDLLCRAPPVAIEIDGYFHFTDPEAYRRDRRKDLALQRAGFVVARVLASDVVERLEPTLQTIVDLIEEEAGP